MNDHTLDASFHDAVAAIDAGDVGTLRNLIDGNPALVSERLESPGAWLREKIGGAVDGFFKRPYLLWFVAEDPVRNGTLPKNIADVARTIIDAARREGESSLQEQLDYALTLVSWSWIARECGVQIDLIDALMDAGADPGGDPANALVNGNVAAAEHLVKRGAQLSLATAVCLGRWDDAERLLHSANEEQKRLAFVLSALNGNAEALRWMLAVGADVNAPSEHLYPHGTPLHHAVCSGSPAAVRALVEAGADLNAPDTAWKGTPLGWAEHYVEEAKTEEKRKQYLEIADYLRAQLKGG